MRMVRSASPAVTLSIAFAGLTALAGCAGSDTTADAPPPSADPPPPGHRSVGSFVMHVRPRAGRIDVRRLAPQIEGAPRVGPENFDSLPIVSDGNTGTGPANTTELATTAIYDTWNGGAVSGCPASSFCGDVQLTHFYAGLDLSAVYVQVTAITTPGGQNDTVHTVTNGVPATPFGIGVSLGAWQYTSLPGTLAAGAPSTQTWAFANPDDQDFYVYLNTLASFYPMLWWDAKGVTQTAPLVAGQPMSIHYDYARAPSCRGTNWIMNGFFRGSYGVNHMVSFPGNGADTYFDVAVTTPFGAANADELWFNNTDDDNCHVWDSNGGSNWKYSPANPSPTTIHFMDPVQYGWKPAPATGSTLKVAGGSVVVDFEPTRAACNVDRYDRIPTGTTLEMGYMFDYDGSTATYVDLTSLPYGVADTINGASGRMYVPATISVPAGTGALSVWFHSTGPSGCEKWDSSDYSSNYNFVVQ